MTTLRAFARLSSGGPSDRRAGRGRPRRRLSQSRASLVRGNGHSTGVDLQRRGDVAVRQVAEVAEGKHFSLAVRKLSERLAQPCRQLGAHGDGFGLRPRRRGGIGLKRTHGASFPQDIERAAGGQGGATALPNLRPVGRGASGRRRVGRHARRLRCRWRCRGSATPSHTPSAHARGRSFPNRSNGAPGREEDCLALRRLVGRVRFPPL